MVCRSRAQPLLSGRVDQTRESSGNQAYYMYSFMKRISINTILLFILQVVVGNLEFFLGKLEYFKEVESEVIPIEVWIGVGSGIALFIIICIVILCWCRRSRRKQKKDIKTLEVQMNNLESKVARECREGEY